MGRFGNGLRLAEVHAHPFDRSLDGATITVDSTIVVLIATILLAGFVSFWDFICTTVLNFITSLGH